MGTLPLQLETTTISKKKWTNTVYYDGPIPL